MLSKRDCAVIKAILSCCNGSETCLIEEEKLRQDAKLSRLKDEKFTKTIDSLSAEGYYDLIRCERGGTPMLCISPRAKARYFKDEQYRQLRSMLIKVLFTLVGSLLAFVISKVLYNIF